MDVFLIDDDEDDIEIFGHVLRSINPRLSFGFSTNSSQALKTLTSGEVNPAYIFIDINMPVLSGLDLLRQLRQGNHLQSARFIIYTTSASAREKLLTEELGAMFISKSDSVRKIAESLKKVL
jgi:CheY-like chemotaxis protein